MIAAALVLWALAADPRSPAADAPPLFLATSVRVHLHASDELEPDYLRALARKNVTLWLSTRSNTLRASTLETINKFSDAWVSLRAPVSEADAHQLDKLPRAGLWLEVKDLDGARRLLGPRRLALRLQGPLDLPLFQKLQQLRPTETLWHAAPDVDLLSWGLFRQLPNRKILARSAVELWPTPCPARPLSGEPTIQTQLQGLLKLSGRSFPCGAGPRIEVPLDTERDVLQGLLVREPSAELVIEVGEDPRAVTKARRLLDDLGLK